MLITRGEAISLLIIVLSVPMQYFIYQYRTTIENHTLDILKQTWQQLETIYTNFTNIGEENTTENPDSDDKHEKVTDDEKSQEEIDKSNYAVIIDDKVRNKRPENLSYRIGEVIMHSDHGYVGIIIGWTIDEASKEPMYHVLINYVRTPRIINVNEHSIIVMKYQEIYLVDMNKYFNGHDGIKYKPKAWLQRLYPLD